MIEYGYACFKSYDIFNSHIFSKGPYPKNKFEKKNVCLSDFICSFLITTYGIQLILILIIVHPILMH